MLLHAPALRQRLYESLMSNFRHGAHAQLRQYWFLRLLSLSWLHAIAHRACLSSFHTTTALSTSAFRLIYRSFATMPITYWLPLPAVSRRQPSSPVVRHQPTNVTRRQPPFRRPHDVKLSLARPTFLLLRNFPLPLLLLQDSHTVDVTSLIFFLSSKYLSFKIFSFSTCFTLIVYTILPFLSFDTTRSSMSFFLFDYVIF